MNGRRLLTLATTVALTLSVAPLASAQEAFVPHDRERGELSPGTQAPTTASLLRAAEGGGTTSSLIAMLEYGERVECHQCVAPLTRNLLESGDSEVRRISAWWLRRRMFAIGAIMAQMKSVLETDADATRRARAAMAIGEFLDPNGLEPLTDAYAADGSPEVRAAVVTALGRLNHPGGITTIASALSDADLTVRRAAIDQVLKVNFFREHDALIGALGDSDTMVRMRAARLTGVFHVDAAVPALVGMLSGDAEVGVRQAAAWALGNIGTAEARAALREAATVEEVSLVRDAIDVAMRMR
ncbi:MAG: HEAT repeat domain-containing protein [Deltaproteobacteria bacterium]|nr:HEAT repeat domain-containing protein [Deltaproteobacteria bacterium]